MCAGSTKLRRRRIEFINFIPQKKSVQSVTSALSFLDCQTKRILIGGFALLLSVIAQGLDVRLAGMVSKALSRCVEVFTPVG